MKNPNQNPLLYLKGIRYKELLMVMKIIYLGQCDVGQQDLQDFISTGTDLQVEGLINDIYMKDIVELTQELEESDSNCIVLKDTTSNMFAQNNERGVILSTNKPEDRLFVCSECNAEFGIKWDLMTHKKCKHEGFRFDCDQCDNSFTSQGSFATHIQSKHEGVRFSCDQCANSYTTHCHLEIHKQSKHEGVRYSCDQCNYKATQHSNLVSHKQSKHQ